LQEILPLAENFSLRIVDKMWPWQTNGSNHAPMSEPELNPALKKRLDDLSDRQDRHERVLKDIRLEWDEMYDKFRLLYARVAKRIKDAAKADDEAPESLQDAPRATKDRIPGYGHPPLHDIARRNY
jgi:hypothetical protein